MKWEISTQEAYQSFNQELRLPQALESTLLAFALKEKEKIYALSQEAPSKSFPLALFDWEELKQASTWKSILQLYPIEKSSMAHYWYSILKTRKVDAGIFLENYGLKLHFQSYADWEELGQLGERSRRLARNYGFPLRILRLWDRLSESEQAQWLRVWGKYDFGRNLIQDIICDYYELEKPARKKALQKALALCHKEESKSSRANKLKLSAQEARSLRDDIRELHSPKIRQMQGKVYKEKRKLSKYFGPNLNLEIPEDLEAHSLQLRLGFSTLDEIRKSIATLKKTEVLTILKNLLNALVK